MSWNVPAQQHRVFERNPLVAVVVELRFFPILKLVERIADIQESVRGTFPLFQDVTRQVIDLQAAASIAVRDERLFTFRKADESSTLTLSTSTLALEARKHEDRRHFIADAMVGLDAVNKACGPVVPTRLGLRYVDIVDKETIEADLQRPTTWPKLIADRFLSVPTGLADLQETVFACEVGSSVASGGGQTVRYGLVQEEKKLKFRLDVDRYIDGPPDTSHVSALLERFADDIFATFVAAMGPDLQAWMPERGARDGD
jgi:uncharacterized protein (TIGR04255 family)